MRSCVVSGGVDSPFSFETELSWLRENDEGCDPVVNLREEVEFKLWVCNQFL